MQPPDPRSVKLIIWDLDDTVWDGTLAEGDAVVLRESVARFIRQISEHGIVSSVCSKNDFRAARDKLVEFGLWEYIVFPNIEFSPKGVRVAGVVAQMQLRHQNTVFIDDWINSRAEVSAACPGIAVVDASSAAELRSFMESTLAAHRHVAKSRLSEYKLLESRMAERKGFAGSNEEFLRSSKITACFVRRQDNLPFAGRIEELINRTNQLNFTKSRVRDGEIRDRILMNDGESESVFVWDQFGYYGLVGFYTVDPKERRVVHLTLSCRVMNMGIEHLVARRIERMYKMEFQLFPIQPHHWIHQKSFFDEAVREYVLSHESRERLPPVARVMANCQSAAIADFTGIGDRIEYDNHPRVFTLHRMNEDGTVLDAAPPLLVYGAFVDYAARHWPEQFDAEHMASAVSRFYEMLTRSGRRALVFIPSDDQLTGQKQEKLLRKLSALWRRHRAPPVLDLRTLRDDEEGRDFRHFSRRRLHEMGLEVREWLDAQQLELGQQSADRVRPLAECPRVGG